jgi:hypothetical protein
MPRKSTSAPVSKQPKKRAKTTAPKASRRVAIPKQPIELLGIPWEQQSGEPAEWYHHFCTYLNSPKHNINKTYRDHLAEVEMAVRQKKAPQGTIIDVSSVRESIAAKNPKVPGNWKRAIAMFRWQERCAAWEQNQAVELNNLWKQRSEAFREEGWQLYEKLRDKVEAMLHIPLLQQRVETQHDANGNPVTVTIIEPARWGFRDTAMLMARTIEVGNTAIGDFSKAIMLLTTAGFDVKAPSTSFDSSDSALSELSKLENLDFGTDLDDESEFIG